MRLVRFELEPDQWQFHWFGHEHNALLAVSRIGLSRLRRCHILLLFSVVQSLDAGYPSDFELKAYFALKQLITRQMLKEPCWINP